ncbi:tail fiber protein [Nocardioides sp. GXZ039]|uniref:tail fiber protein n=1 Tax=Nocardioides sp. GXZ039 TaxID=3136018 RepID=UPI0030F375FB
MFGSVGSWLTPPRHVLTIYTAVAQATAYATTELMRVKAGHPSVGWRLVFRGGYDGAGLNSSVGYKVRFDFYNASRALISSSQYWSAGEFTTGYKGGGLGTMPAGTAFVALRIDLVRNTGTPQAFDQIDFNEVCVATGTSLDQVGSMVFYPPVQYVDVIGPALSINTSRDELNVGTLSASIRDASIDPSTSTLIRPGRRVRLMAKVDDGTADPWKPVFTGKISNGKVTYELKDPDVPDSRRAKIELTATDNATPLSAQNRSDGVSSLAELPYLLEGCGVPWNIDGNGDQVSTATIVAKNENASALDQVSIARDSAHGFAWVDRLGVLQVRSRTKMPTASSPLLATEYTDLDVDYDTERCINEVTIKYLRLNPVTGETEEIPYGPWRNETSILEWGVRSAEFTVQGIAEESSALASFAQAVLDANSTPKIRVNSTTVIVDEATAQGLPSRVLVDLYDLITVKGVTGQPDRAPARVASIEHKITPDKWQIVLGFVAEGSVASPQFTPSPPTGNDGKTIGQLLRPVGEVTMFMGAKADIPAGWLALDGSTFSATQYPKLYALNGNSTTLPNMADRFPIGAGTKALGTVGGSPTANVPAHTHPDTFAVSKTFAAVPTGTGGGNRLSNIDFTGAVGSGGAASISVLNPWRSIWFIVRAV